MREFVGDAKGKQFKFYNEVDDAINDPDPRLKPQVYSADITLLGEIKLVLVPAEDQTSQAVRALVKLGKPADIKVKKKGSK
jgi:hypothetical protein